MPETRWSVRNVPGYIRNGFRITGQKARGAFREPFGDASVSHREWSFPSYLGLSAVFGLVVTVLGIGPRLYSAVATGVVAAASLLSFAVLGRPRKAPERSPREELDLLLIGSADDPDDEQ